MDPLSLQICNACLREHEDRTGGWMTRKAYREATGTDPVTCRLVHTYCPACFIYILNENKAA